MSAVDDRIEEVWRLEAGGESNQAQELIERLTVDNPDDPRVHLTAGSYYVYSRRDRARAALRRAAQLAPAWIEAYVYLAASHQVGGQRRWALSYARRGLDVARRHWEEVSQRDYVELLFEEAEALCSAGDRAGALRGLRKGLDRLGVSARVSDAVGNLEACRVRGDRRLVVDTLRDALDVARFQSRRGSPLDRSVADEAACLGRPVTGRVFRVRHAGWAPSRPPLLCFANHGKNTVRTFRCWTCGASHGERAAGEGSVELHVDHSGPWPDLLAEGTLVSARVLDALHREGLGGYRSFPVDVRVKGRRDFRPGYFWLEVPVSVAVDWRVLGLREPKRCAACGAVAATPRRGLRLLGAGPALFRCESDHEAVLADERVLTLARAEGWTGFRFVPESTR